MCIWHVDVKFYDDCYHGLFTFMDKPGNGHTRLYNAKSLDGITWNIETMIRVGETCMDVYKATSYCLEKRHYVVASAMDIYNRWFLFRKEMETKSEKSSMK